MTDEERMELEAMISDPGSTPDEVRRAQRKLNSTSVGKDGIEVCEVEVKPAVQTTYSDKPKRNELREHSDRFFAERQNDPTFPKGVTAYDQYLCLLLGGTPAHPGSQKIWNWWLGKIAQEKGPTDAKG